MKFTVLTANAFSQSVPALVMFAFQNERLAAPASLKSMLRRLTVKEFDGSDKQLHLLHTAGKPGIRAGRVLLVGLGKRADFTTEKLRRATGRAVRRLSDAGLDRAAIQTDNPAVVAEAAILASYKFTEFKSRDDHTSLKSLTLCVPAKTDIRRDQIIAESSNFARSIGNLR